jgi:xanthine/uracil permease
VTFVEGYNGAEGPGIGELFSDLAKQSRTLVIQEVALAKVELSEKISQATKGLTYVAIGGAVAYAGFLALVGAAIFGLALYMSAWLAALIVGVVVAIFGYILIQVGLNDLKPKDLKPEQTIQSVKETQEWAKKQI